MRLRLSQFLHSKYSKSCKKGRRRNKQAKICTKCSVGYVRNRRRDGSKEEGGLPQEQREADIVQVACMIKYRLPMGRRRDQGPRHGRTARSRPGW